MLYSVKLANARPAGDWRRLALLRVTITGGVVQARVLPASEPAAPAAAV